MKKPHTLTAEDEQSLDNTSYTTPLCHSRCTINKDLVIASYVSNGELSSSFLVKSGEDAWPYFNLSEAIAKYNSIIK